MKFSLAFLAGVVGLLTLPALPAAWFGIVALCVAVAGFGLRSRIGVGLLLCGFASGALLAWGHALQYLTLRWPESRADVRVIARIVVDTLPVRRGESWLFDGVAVIEKPDSSGPARRVRVVWPKPPEHPRAGEQWRLLLSLQAPRVHVNVGAPDTE